MLHAELDRLSPPERSAVLLCDVEGLSHQEAADQLGWPLSTVKTRITRGRDRLRARLTRRGVTLSASALTASLAEQAVAAAVPRTLIAATARAAVALGGPTLALGLSPSVAPLTPGAARTMILGKLKALTLGLAATTTAVVAPGVIARPPQVPYTGTDPAIAAYYGGRDGQPAPDPAGQSPAPLGQAARAAGEAERPVLDATPPQPPPESAVVPALAEPVSPPVAPEVVANNAPPPLDPGPGTEAPPLAPAEVIAPPVQEPPPSAAPAEGIPQYRPGVPPPGEPGNADLDRDQRGVAILRRLEQPLAIPNLLDHFENPDHPTFFGLTRIITAMTRSDTPLIEGIPIEFTPEARKVARRRPVNVAQWEPKDNGQGQGPNLRTKLTREAGRAGLAYTIQNGTLVFDLAPEAELAQNAPAENEAPTSQSRTATPFVKTRNLLIAPEAEVEVEQLPPVPNSGRSPFQADEVPTPTAPPVPEPAVNSAPPVEGPGGNPTPRPQRPRGADRPAAQLMPSVPPSATEPTPQPTSTLAMPAPQAPPLVMPVGATADRVRMQQRQLQDQERNEAILAQLDKPVTLKFAEKVSFDQLLAFVRQEARGPNGKPIPIYVDPQVFVKKTVDEPLKAGEATITIDLEDIPLRTGLRLALKQVNLTYTVTGGLLIISAPETIPGFADPGRNPMGGTGGGMGGMGGMM